MADGKGLRYNQGKTRFDLLPVNSLEKMAEILTVGAAKYGERNWERGMKWSNVTGSLQRHLAEFNKGNDFDTESGKLHIAHVAVNALFLLEYYRVYPQGDDRPVTRHRIGLDLDDTICEFSDAYYNNNNESGGVGSRVPVSRDPNIDLTRLSKSFWTGLKPKIDPKTLAFTPVCYITHRSIPTEWSKEWLENNRFPIAPIYNVPPGENKSEVAKKMELDIFVDDNPTVFTDFQTNYPECVCWLMDSQSNRNFQVGYKRVTDLEFLM